MKFGKNTYDELRSRFDRWNRERKERAEERRAEKQAAMMRDQHAHSRFWLLNVPALATICAAVVEWYWAVLFCIEATGQLGMDWRTSVGSDVPGEGAWHFLFDIQSVWVLIGLILATMPIVMLSMIWLPVQFAMRGAGAYRRGSLIAVGVLANVLVIVSGTVVMNYNRQDQVRETLVVEQTAAQGRAAIDARLAFEQEQLRLALSNSNPYLNQAANVGAAEWERSYVAQARASNDPRLPMLERALGAARAADQRRANIEALTVQRAQAAPEAASAAVVEDNVGRELNTFAQYVEVWRPPFVAFICTLIGIFGAWWTLAMLERLNPKDVLRSGWADDGHRIEDLRHEEEIAPQPMKPPREVVTDAQTGEELVKVRPREYWRKRVPKKGVPTRVNVEPETLPDETGVDYDGGARIATREEQAMSGAMVGEREESVAPTAINHEAQHEDDKPDQDAPQESQPEPSFSDDDLASLETLADLEPTPPETTNQSADAAIEPTPVIDANPEQVSEDSDNGEMGEPANQDEPQEEPEDERVMPRAALTAAE